MLIEIPHLKHLKLKIENQIEMKWYSTTQIEVRDGTAEHFPDRLRGAAGEAEHALEGPLEVGIAEGVEDGVKRRVEVAEPDGGGE